VKKTEINGNMNVMWGQST